MASSFPSLATQPVSRPSGAPAVQRTTPIAVLAVAVGALTLVITILVSTAVVTPDDSASVARLYLVANIALYAAVVIDRRAGGASVIAAFFFLFFVAVPAAVQVGAGAFPFGASYTPQELGNTYAVLSVAQLSFVAGLVLHRRDAPRQAARKMRVLTVTSAVRIAVVLDAACLVIAAYVGPQALLFTRSELASSVVSDEGVVQQLLFVGRSLSLVACVLMILTVKRSSTSTRHRPLVRGLTAASVVVLLVMNFPPALPRFQLLGAALAVLATLFDLHRPVTKTVFTACAVLFLLFLFPAIKVIGEGRGIDLERAFGNDVAKFLLRVDFDNFKQTADTLIYLQHAPLRHGENFLGVLLFWVPRSVWPDKPLPTGALVSSSLGYVYTNVGNPLPAEALVSFGYLGVVIVMALFGWLVWAVERDALHSAGSYTLASSVVLYALLIGFATIILRGALNSVAPIFMSAFVAYLVIWGVSRRAGGQQRARQGRAARSSSGVALAEREYQRRRSR